MKKFAAIVLLCLYSFNLFGYLLLFHIMESKAEEHLQTSLDEETYVEADLISLTVPLSLPYITDTKRFERVDGEITIDGKLYHYVKRAIKNGALVLLCLPDHQKMRLESARTEFYKLVGDFQQTKPTKKNEGKADLFKDIRAKYCPTATETIGLAHVTTASIVYSSRKSFIPPSRLNDLPEQPPELS